jgi:DNA-binding transcriptional ArsR family regulator
VNIEEMTDEQVEELGEAFFALSNAQRLRLLQMLTEPRYREEIADGLGMTRQSATKHIDKLAEHGFVEELEGWRETGPVQEFRVDPKRLFALGTTLLELGKLEPEGGPETTTTDPTQVFPEDEVPSLEEVDPDASAHLLLLDGPDAGDRFPITGEGPRWTIGRAEDRDLILDHDPYVSNHQCELQVDPTGHAVVDTYSSNGTFVNFGRLPEGGRTSLSAGDVLRVGRTHLVYQRD